MNLDIEKIGSGLLDEAKPDSLTAYEAHAHVVRALRRAGYFSENLEFLILAHLERLASIADLKDELRALGVPEARLQAKTQSELFELLAEASAHIPVYPTSKGAN